MTIDLPVSLQPEGFGASLLALQTHLQGFLAEYEDKVAQARTQLAHVEALLGSIPAEAPKATKKKEAVVVEAPTPVAPVAVVPEVAPVAKERKLKAKTVEAPAPVAPVAKGRGRGHRRGSLTMRPSYEGLTLTEAIEKILNERFGQAVNADDVVNILYGDLTETVFRVAKERVTKNLSKGKGEGKWKRVPTQLGYYTLSLEDLKTIPTSTIKRGRAASVKPAAAKAVKAPKKAIKETKATKAPKATATPKAAKVVAATKAKKTEAPAKPAQSKKSGRMSSLIMRPLYHGNTLTDAIEKVLQERKGEFVNADSVVKALYGDLSVENFRQAKDRVTKNLSKGKLDGKWERVPNQLGYYTLSMSAVKA
jgi:outer membrane biosynthesis protein TonB